MPEMTKVNGRHWYKDEDNYLKCTDETYKPVPGDLEAYCAEAFNSGPIKLHLRLHTACSKPLNLYGSTGS